jgi:1,2-diacylglycerol 3-alpha-glucosyltransferase
MRFSVKINDPLIEELIEWKPDIIHVQSEASVLMMAKKIQKKCNVPLIMTSNTDYTYFLFGKMKNKPMIRKLSTIVGKVFYAPAFRIIVPSKKALDFSFLQPYKDRLIVVPNGIELNKYQKTLSESEEKQLRETLGIPKNNKTLCVISRLSKEKNIKELINFLPDLLKVRNDITYLIVGDGPARKELEKQVRLSGLQSHVVFAGQQPLEEVWRYLALSDIFMSASLFEVHSMSYLEALAGGLPLLCKNDKSLKGVLKHGVNGFIYNNRTEYVKYALNLIGDDELRKRLGSASLIKAEDFTSEKFAENVIKVYEDSISKWRSEK